ncbi:MAG TPA: PQQ-dependent sugar dehydrogenase [Caulobacteraceae bacterium]|jgi:glucose/arabinose dehydrogenase
MAVSAFKGSASAPRLLALTAAATALAACGQGAAQGSGPVAPGAAAASLETRRANTRYQPAFPGQTRAPLARSNAAFDTQVIARGLDHPWAVEVMRDGRMLVTEKPGRLRIISLDGRMSPPVTGLPAVFAENQGGLLDVALGPDGLVYWSYAERRPDGDGTAVARSRLVDGPAPRMEAVQVIFRMQPTLKSGMHFGSRLVFAPDGKLFVTLGERSILPGRAQAQRLDSHFGKIVRINPDGSIPSDNPFTGQAGARPEIWVKGVRNVQSAALDPQGRLWEVEHGPKGGDELNLIEKGKDYGWPAISYGIEYSGGPIGPGRTQAPGMEQPVYYWDPVIAPSGMAFYTGALFPAWKGSLFVGGLKDKRLIRLVLQNDRVVGEEWFDIGQRVRDVVQGPDGALYLVTDEADGRLLRLAPRR